MSERTPPGRERRVPSGLTVDEDVAREIRTHIELRAEELVEKGWERAAACEEALRRFGDAAAVARECTRIARRTDRADRRARMTGSLVQDIRYGARTLARAPGFTAVAVVTLALGIGANSAIFSVVNGVLLRPLPYEEPAELAWVAEWQREGRPMGVAWLNFVDWHAESTSFEALAAYGSGTSVILGGQRPVSGGVASVSVDFWRVFGVDPARGRLTVASDHRPGAQPAFVVSERFWANELGGADLDAANLEIQGLRARVVGVVPSGLGFPEGTDVWGPAELFPHSNSRTSHNWRVVGRLHDGVTVAQAEREMDALTRRIVQDEPAAAGDYLAVGATVVPLHERLVGDTRRPLYLLLGAAGLVLLVACTNLASTLLARGSARTRELAVRVSLGAGRGRIVRQLLTESLLLAGLGAVAGLALAGGALTALTRLGPATLPRLEAVGVDGSVLLYTAAVAVLTAMLFGLFPVVRLTRGDAALELRSGTRGNAADRRGIAWGFLVATEIALALVLLVGSGLLVRSLQALLAEDAGFEARDVTAAEIELSRIKYESPADHALWYEGFIRELEALPGVAAAGVISTAPVSGSLPSGRMERDGDMEAHADAGFVLASAGAFEALDIPLLQGRLFDERDRPGSPRVAIVSRAFADRYWPGQDPVGRSVSGGGMDVVEGRPFHEVVGVVGDVRFRNLGEEPVPVVYFPYAQRPYRLPFGATVVVESATGDPATVAPGLRATLQRLDPDVPLRITTLETRVGASVSDRRFTALLVGGLSVIALVLAGVGVYGVVSYSVARRTREMGIRMALGADAGRVRALVITASLRPVLAGLVLGLVGARAMAVTIRGLLYEVGPGDPVTLATSVALLAAVGVLATWLPARAGTRVDPMITMRAE